MTENTWHILPLPFHLGDNIISIALNNKDKQGSKNL